MASNQQGIEAFLYHEARLLDEGRFREWEDLWTDDGVYWVPAENGTYDPSERVSIIYDDRPTLAKRIERLSGPDAHAGQPPPVLRRIVSNIEVGTATDQNDIYVESNFIAASFRREEQEFWSGRVTHHLRSHDGSFRISFKKVALVNCAAFLPTLPFLP